MTNAKPAPPVPRHAKLFQPGSSDTRYRKIGTGGLREVELDGEVFLKVSTDASSS